MLRSLSIQMFCGKCGSELDELFDSCDLVSLVLGSKMLRVTLVPGKETRCANNYD